MAEGKILLAFDEVREVIMDRRAPGRDWCCFGDRVVRVGCLSGLVCTEAQERFGLSDMFHWCLFLSVRRQHRLALRFASSRHK